MPPRFLVSVRNVRPVRDASGMIILGTEHRGSARWYDPVPAPDAMVQWCRQQPLPLALYEDSATVDLDWWNHKLWEHRIPITLLGRGPDGEIVDQGSAEITRLDLFKHARFSDPVEASPFSWGHFHWALAMPRNDSFTNDAGHLLTLLYLCAAWASGHSKRNNRRVFQRYCDGADESGLISVSPALAISADYIGFPPSAYAVLQRQNTVLGELGVDDKIPGLGPVVASHFLAALSAARRGPRRVPVESTAINMLVRCGWHEFDPGETLTTRNYCVFQETIRDWALEAKTAPELVEMWLVNSWHELRSGERSPL